MQLESSETETIYSYCSSGIESFKLTFRAARARCKLLGIIKQPSNYQQGNRDVGSETQWYQRLHHSGAPCKTLGENGPVGHKPTVKICESPIKGKFGDQTTNLKDRGETILSFLRIHSLLLSFTRAFLFLFRMMVHFLLLGNQLIICRSCQRSVGFNPKI